MRLFSAVFLLTLFLTACRKDFVGNPKENQPPETNTVVDTIIRIGPDRLQSQITLHWWGDDPDGIVKGYQFTFDSIISPATNWIFTTRTDSDFVLPIPPGLDTVDFDFYVRAVDNNDLVDPTPAHLGIPVKNSPPTISFVSGLYNPLKTFPVLKFYWNANDPDGNESLKQIELVWNDTLQTPFVIDATAQSATFEATNPSGSSSDVNVYINNSLTSLELTMPGLMLNDSNVLYIRAVDNSLAKSSFVGSYKVSVKKVTASILLVDGYGNSGATTTTFYTQNLQSISITQFDTLQIFQTVGGEYTQVSPDNLTQSRIFKLFSTIVWYSNDATKSLSLAQKTLGQFFDNGGKLLMSTYVSGSFDQQSTFLNFTPAQALVALPTDTILTMNSGAALYAVQTGWEDSLKTTTIIGTVRPFVPTIGATPLYDAVLLAKKVSTGTVTPWTGPSTVIAKKTNGAGEVNFIFSVMELQKLNGLNNMTQLFDNIFHDEFGL